LENFSQPLHDAAHAVADIRPVARNVPRFPMTVWLHIAQAAAQTAAREPFLRAVLDELVLVHAAPSRIVAATLARRLAAGHAPDPAVAGLVADTLDDDPATLASVEADLGAVTARDPACRSPLHALLHLKGFHALQAHRVAHGLWRRGRIDTAFWLAGLAAAALGVDIHPAVPVGAGVVLDHATGIVVGETAVIEDGVTLLHGVTLGATGKQRGDRHPKVRAGAMIGAGTQVLGDIEIGRMSRVGAGSVVLRDVPAFATVAGVPARVVRRPQSQAGGRFSMNACTPSSAERSIMLHAMVR
jgi:serine O-acetyltransferase